MIDSDRFPPSKVQYFFGREDIENFDNATFSHLQKLIAIEADLLHPTADALLQSFQSGQAIIALDNSSEKRPIGYVRLEPLLSNSIRKGLGLTDGFPEIAELGTMFVEEGLQYRGKGHMRKMCNQLFEAKHQELSDCKLLVIGTAKDSRVIRTLQGISSAHFEVCHHLDLPHLAALTCICNGTFGSGFQNNPLECNARLDNFYLGKVDELARHLKETSSTKIRCVMFVSNKELALKIDAELAKLFSAESSVMDLRDRLMELGYYPDNKTFFSVESLMKSAVKY